MTGEYLDRRIATLLDEIAPQHEPEYADAVRAKARVQRQRPAWTFPSRWLPFDLPERRFGLAASPVWLLVALGLLVLLVIAAYVGTRQRVPEPFGPASNGLIAYDVDGRIVVVDANGKTRVLTTDVDGLDSRVSFSRDGLKIAFWRETARNVALIVADADGSDQHELVSLEDQPGTGFALEAPQWAPASDRLAITVVTESGPDPHAEIWIVDVATGAHSVLLPPSLFGAQGPVWSPDAKRIAFLGEPTRRPEGFLYVANLDGSELLRLSERPSNGEAGYLFRPSWSSDGRRIAITYGDSAKLNRDVLLLATDHLEESVLVGSPKDDAHPAWAPDDRQIAFWRSTNGYRWQLVVLDMETTIERVSTWESNTADTLAWSPDGTTISVTNCDDTTCWLYLLDAADPAAEPLLVAELPPKSYEISHDQAYWSWQRLAP